MLSGFYTNVARKGNQILYRGYDENGSKVYEKFKFRPVMYLESKDPNAKWRSLDDVPLEPMRFDSMSDCKAFIKQYEGISSFKIYGNEKHLAAFVQSQFPGEIKYDKRLINICYIDIEVDYGDGYCEASEATNEMLSIAWKSSRSETYLVWGLKDYDVELMKAEGKRVEFRQFKTESSMLKDFLNYWADPMNTPDIVTGWNTLFFDMPYIVNRLALVLGHDEATRLSPWGMVDERRTTIQGRECLSFDISGIEQLDFMDLFKKFCTLTYGAQESYKLDHIAWVVLGDHKIDYSEDGSLQDLYDNNFQKFIDYNIKDVEIVERLEQKLNLLNLACNLAYGGGVNYTDTLGTTAIWDAIIFRRLAKKHVAVFQPRQHGKTDYPGGHVKEPVPNMYDWVMAFDLNSLYPNLIIQYNMSPETLMKNLHVPGVSPDSILRDHSVPWSDPDYAVSGSGAVFRRDKQGIIPEIVEELYNRRVIIKKEMLKNKKLLETLGGKNTFNVDQDIARLETEQMTIKTLMNSLYGAMGNQYFRYFDLDLAIAITLSGQAVIRLGEESMNAFLNKFAGTEKDRIIAIDTDSLYVHVEDIITKFKPKNPVAFLDELGSKAIEPMLTKAFDKLAEFTNAYKNTMAMKREVIADRGIWIAKKRYILNVHNSEGVQYAEPKIKMVGIQAVQSSTPQVCRGKFKEMFKIIMNGTEQDIQKAIADFANEFRKLPPEEVAFPRGANHLKKWSDRRTIYKSGTPIQVRGALLHNRRVADLGLTKHCELIKSGDKVKFSYLKKPNHIGENVFAWKETLNPEFGIHKYIDYDTQFEKAFIIPLRKILDAVGWSVVQRSSLDDFFI